MLPDRPVLASMSVQYLEFSRFSYRRQTVIAPGRSVLVSDLP